MADDALLQNPREIGRRIGAACGYSGKKQKEIAAELGRDERTLRSYIGGNLGDYSTPELRLVLIRRVEEITECPPGIFGLSAPGPGEVDRLRQEMLAQKNELRAEATRERALLEARLSSLEIAVRGLKSTRT